MPVSVLTNVFFLEYKQQYRKDLVQKLGQFCGSARPIAVNHTGSTSADANIGVITESNRMSQYTFTYLSVYVAQMLKL